MARRKKESSLLAKAMNRLAGAKSIGDKLDVSNGVSTAALERDVNFLRETLEGYNTLLSKVDAAAIEIIKAEKKVAQTSKMLLAGVAIKFGDDSPEYEMAGGTRASRRRRRPRKSAAPAPEATPKVD
jgi:hypothetical protein